MEQIASRIVLNMMQANLINENEYEEYIYGIQILLEKVISYFIIILIALILQCLFEIILFLLSFSFLRKYSGGIHCKRYITCLVVSTLVTFSSVVVFPLAENNILLYQGGVIMSIIIVILIGAINNPNISWNENEYKRTRYKSRFIVLMETIVLVVLFLLRIPFSFRFYISYGIVVTAVSMLLEIRKKGGIADEVT